MILTIDDNGKFPHISQSHIVRCKEVRDPQPLSNVLWNDLIGKFYPLDGNVGCRREIRPVKDYLEFPIDVLGRCERLRSKKL